ncbi:T9SS type A sorting domain-containing protein [Weeksellaceae bacterium KMM 9713]|uniref:T9SS type A sorting domain-containing protein n=1 Tax=Profundicola chukchiensis TaxID=2961959 RepID=A0A9X4MYY4_9FLAO|nr:T9SS type A sorting domain-containing protein [Profundicola chukchiensis]MDG4946579.1 T9SS type A sorting domain-containing protein [Profundicola chukchiensis]
MRNFTLLMIAIFMSLGLNAQENECAIEVQEGGGNAWGELHKYIFASDFVLQPNQVFNLTSLNFNAILTPGKPVEGATIYFYEDTGMGPGTELGSQEITEVEVDVFGNYANLDHATISLDLNTPFQFVGNADAQTTYWVGIMIDFEQDSMSYIEVTSEFDTANATYFYDFQSESWINGDNPAWPIGGFEHAMVSLYGDCETLAVQDLTETKFNHVVHDNQLFVEHSESIDELIIYNSLGKQLIEKKVKSDKARVNLHSLKPGVYIGNIKVEREIKSFKFVIK